jgi:hypothetical protein
MNRPTDPKKCKHYEDGFCGCFPIKVRNTWLISGNRTTMSGKSCELLRKKGNCPDFTPKTKKQ